MHTNETLEIIKRRRSHRAFISAPVAEETLRAIAESGLCAPCTSERAWHFAVVTNTALLAQFVTASKEAAMRTPIPHLQALGADPDFNCLYGAPALIIISGAIDSVAPEMECAAATENMLLAAESLGIGACWMYFPLQAFDGPEGPVLRGALSIPDGYRAVCAVALGHIAGSVGDAPSRDGCQITYVR